MMAKSFERDIQTHPSWNFCREHVKDSMFFRFDYEKMNIRKIPIKFVNLAKCEAVENGKKCKEYARYSILYETMEMIERNRNFAGLRNSVMMSKTDFNNEIYQRIMKDVFIIMTPHSPQDQLLAGGEMNLIMEIANGLGYKIQEILSYDTTCKKALDFIAEMRHHDCESLKKRNKKLSNYKKPKFGNKIHSSFGVVK